MQLWAVGQTFFRFSEYQVESMPTGIQLGDLQDLEHWEECQALLQVSHVLGVVVPLSISTHRLLQ